MIMKFFFIVKAGFQKVKKMILIVAVFFASAIVAQHDLFSAAARERISDYFFRLERKSWRAGYVPDYQAIH